MDLYDGMTDRRHHLSNFKKRIYLADVSDATRGKAFLTTLTKAAMKWFVACLQSRSPALMTRLETSSQDSQYKRINQACTEYLGSQTRGRRIFENLHRKTQQGMLGYPKSTYGSNNHGAS
ncbi:hypothetical protein AHAS_Ahas15G0274700 [Arachis hypogaea]